MASRRTRILTAVAVLSFSTPPWAQDYDELDDTQRDLLAPLAEIWDELPDERRARVIDMADRVADQPEARQDRFRRGLHRFMSLSPEQRRGVRALHRRFGSLPMAERRHIIERVEDMSPEQREAFAFGVRAADHTRRTRAVDRFVRDLPADQRRAMIAELEAIESAPERLRRIAEWMEMSDDQRAARAGEAGDE